MKQFIMIALAALITTASAVGMAATPVHFSDNELTVKNGDKTINISVDTTATNGVKTIIAINGDTIISTGVNKLANRLNDTLFASSFYTSSDNSDDSDDDSSSVLKEMELNYQYEYKQAMQEKITAMVITGIVFGTILFIVIACLVIYYLNRRNRLRVIEKAIDNNYQLPDSFFTGRTAQQHCEIIAPAGNTQKGSNARQLFAYTSEAEMRQGIKLAIVGIGLILFFALLGIDFFAALSVIPLLLGLSKIFIPYLTRKNIPTPPQKPVNPTTPPQQPDSVQEPPTFSHSEEQQENK